MPFGRPASSLVSVAARRPSMARLMHAEARRKAAKPETGKFQRSSVERQPKVLVAVFAFGITGGLLSIVSFFEFTRPRCEASSTSTSPSDSLMTVIEPVTETKFPLTLQDYAGYGSTHWLVARTVRCMLGLCSFERARAYSYAIYFSTEAAEACKKAENMDAVREKLLPTAPCVDEAHAGDYEMDDLPDFIAATKFDGAKKGYVFKMDAQNGGLGYHKDTMSRAVFAVKESRETAYPSIALRLVMLRDQNGDHIAHGFDRTLLGRIRTAQENKKGPGKDALRKLTQLVGRQDWHKGDTLEFVRLPHGFVDVLINGDKRITLKSESFSWAVFDAYLGPKGHLTDEARKELLSRTEEIAELL